ncbi:DNA-binding helix-turn-helix protein [Leptospira inadai serovar Lyme str. 10]|uniref:DNA-binding helix-turn-helix protein n=2 Tax=Leptospira inadai serovar Lyme TaxID=293084 RepID=V6HIA1_9LEPT|nr:helix-turn-helix domain-containing protein [Leptospira inadai]EQA36335.1 DNA-binding helix-turn-helix protein [Leptospira inadai serovar Lyme str. 10]PNV73639.1 AraC family transcriptional regulator [Leptospira inadai serovar Lyme]
MNKILTPEEYYILNRSAFQRDVRTVNSNACVSPYLKVQEDKFLLVGQTDVSVDWSIKYSSTNTFAIKLGPGFIFKYLKIPADAFTNTVVDLKEILSREKFAYVRELTGSYSTADEKVLQILNFLKKVDVEKNAILSEFIAHRIMEKSDLQLEKLALEIGYSSRQIRRLVLSYTGFTPQLLQRITKFEKCRRSLLLQNENPILPLVQKTYENKYSDQSHMIREFKRFSGENPSSYLSKMSELSNTESDVFVKIIPELKGDSNEYNNRGIGDKSRRNNSYS